MYADCKNKWGGIAYIVLVAVVAQCQLFLGKMVKTCFFIAATNKYIHQFVYFSAVNELTIDIKVYKNPEITKHVNHKVTSSDHSFCATNSHKPNVLL